MKSRGMEVGRRSFVKSLCMSMASSAMVPIGNVLSENVFGSNQDKGSTSTSPSKVATVDDDIVRSLETAKLSLRFRGSTADEFRQWKQTFRAKLESLLGDSTPPRHWTAQEEEQTDCGDHIRYSFLLQADRIPHLPIYFLVPKTLANGKRAPAVVCLHGHGEFGHHPIVGRSDVAGMKDDFENTRYDYGRQFVRRGYLVAAPCMIPFGRRLQRQGYGGNDPCAVTFVRMQALGQLPMTANLRDIRWTIDFLLSREEVLREKVGCAGLSYGGRMTMLAAAIDERIRVAAVSGALNLMQERMSIRHSCGSQIIPGLLKYGDFSEIGSLIAPRPCVWETGSSDSLIVPQWDDLFRERLQKAYTAANASSSLRFDRFAGGHVWSGQIAYPLFDEILKG